MAETREHTEGEIQSLLELPADLQSYITWLIPDITDEEELALLAYINEQQLHIIPPNTHHNYLPSLNDDEEASQDAETAEQEGPSKNELLALTITMLSQSIGSSNRIHKAMIIVTDYCNYPIVMDNIDDHSVRRDKLEGIRRKADGSPTGLQRVYNLINFHPHRKNTVMVACSAMENIFSRFHELGFIKDYVKQLPFPVYRGGAMHYQLTQLGPHWYQKTSNLEQFQILEAYRQKIHLLYHLIKDSLIKTRDRVTHPQSQDELMSMLEEYMSEIKKIFIEEVIAAYEKNWDALHKGQFMVTDPLLSIKHSEQSFQI